MTKKIDPALKRDREWLRSGMLVPLNIDSEPLEQQCEHASAAGQYVIRVLPGVRIASEKRWHAFDPPTKLQTLSWVGRRRARHKRKASQAAFTGCAPSADR